MTRKDLLALVVAIIICELAGVVGSAFTISAIPTWYAGLVRPALNPPSWIFAPVWTTLYAMMGLAAFLVWRTPKSPARTKALVAFGAQLVLNALWSIIFFGFRILSAASIEIVVLWIAIALTIARFRQLSRPAAWLLAPYLAWVTFAAYLTFSIWKLN